MLSLNQSVLLQTTLTVHHEALQTLDTPETTTWFDASRRQSIQKLCVDRLTGDLRSASLKYATHKSGECILHRPQEIQDRKHIQQLLVLEHGGSRQPQHIQDPRLAPTQDHLLLRIESLQAQLNEQVGGG